MLERTIKEISLRFLYYFTIFTVAIDFFVYHTIIGYGNTEQTDYSVFAYLIIKNIIIVLVSLLCATEYSDHPIKEESASPKIIAFDVIKYVFVILIFISLLVTITNPFTQISIYKAINNNDFVSNTGATLKYFFTYYIYNAVIFLPMILYILPIISKLYEKNRNSVYKTTHGHIYSGETLVEAQNKNTDIFLKNISDEEIVKYFEALKINYSKYFIGKVPIMGIRYGKTWNESPIDEIVNLKKKCIISYDDNGITLSSLDKKIGIIHISNIEYIPFYSIKEIHVSTEFLKAYISIELEHETLEIFCPKQNTQIKDQILSIEELKGKLNMKKREQYESKNDNSSTN